MDQRNEARPPLQGSTYPRIYNIGGIRKIVQLGLGSVFLLGGLAFAAWIVTNFADVRKDDAWFVPIILSALMILIGAALAFFTLRYRLILHADAVELASPIGGWTIRRDDIAGRRAQTVVINGISFPYLFLVEKGERAKKRRIFNVLQTDPVLDGWLASLPDLDQRQHDENVREVLQNPDFGDTEETRAVRLLRAGKIASYLNGAGVFFGLGVMTILPGLIPDYYWWLIAALAVLPVLAVVIVIVSKGLFCIDGEEIRNTARPNLSGLFILPPIALTLRAWIDIDVLDWQRALEIGALVGLAAGLVSLAARSKAKSSPVLLLAFSLVWASGAAVFYNSYFDKSVPSIFRTRIMDMHKTTGKSTSYYLKLQPWGPRTEAQDVQVVRDFYDAVSTGKTVCVYLFGGALDVRWFEVSRCQ